MREVYAGMAEEAELPDSPVSCIDCDSGFLYPTEVIEGLSSANRCLLVCRCGNCGKNQQRVCSRDTRDFLEDKVQQGQTAIAEKIRDLKHEEFEEWIDRFVTALNAELILPEDF